MDCKISSKCQCPRLLTFAFVGFALSTLLAPFSIYAFPNYLYVFFFVFLILTLISYNKQPSIFTKDKVRHKQVKLWSIAWLVMFGFCLLHLHMPPQRYWPYFFYGILFFKLDIIIQKKIVSTFVRVLALLLAISIVEFLVYHFTHVGIVLGEVIRNSVTFREIPITQLPFNMIEQSVVMPRFCGLAEEPGLIGTLSAFLLFYTDGKTKYRIHSCVFLLAGFLSMSLAFFILLMIFLTNKLRSLKQILISFVVGCAIIFTLYHFFQDQFQEMIVERIAGETIETIDNRSSDTFDNYFMKSVKSSQILWGTGGYLPEDIFGRTSDGGYSKGIAGAKKWIYQYGLICFIIIFFAYIRIYKANRNRILICWDYAFLISFWLSFYQRETILETYTFLAYFGVSLNNRITC